jgi:FkbM family methyltransferase
VKNIFKSIFLNVKFNIKLIYIFLVNNQRFYRLSPGESGSIHFYDRKKRNVFKVWVRDRIDSIVADQIFSNHDYNLEILTRHTELKKYYLRKIELGKIPLIIDCGANIGLASRYFAEEFPLAKVIAIEPEKENYQLLLKNTKANKNVIPLNCAIGSSNSEVYIDTVNQENNGFRMSFDNNGTEAISLISMSAILNKFAGMELFIVKIDIEGFESDLFSKNTDWVQYTPLLIIETHDWMLPGQGNSKNFLKVISSLNRDFVHNVGENIFSIDNNLDSK